MVCENLHAKRNKHIWKLICFLDKKVTSNRAKWNDNKPINHGSC